MAFSQEKTVSTMILDEIALEGLEGITISGLWTRLSESLQLPLPLLDRFQTQVWNIVIGNKTHLSFFELPEVREKLKLWNRFSVTDPDYGLPLSLVECPFNLYKCVPIQDGEILGSCESYDTRKPIEFDEIKSMSLREIEEKWGDKLVIVGSQKLRFNCLVPSHVSKPTEITSSQYCVLEFIGRSRKNGITSAGKFSILHCCRDSAIGFYIRNKLIRMGLITKQSYTEKRYDRLVSSCLLTLARFHSQNKTAFTARIEKMFFALKHAPNQRMALSSLRQLFPTENQSCIKKIQTTHFFKKFFSTSNISVKDLADLKQTARSNGEREVLCVRLKNPNLEADELFNDDEAEEDKDFKNFFEYKHSFVDMPFAEEIFRAIEKHGSEGCSQSQLCTNLSMNHLSVRQTLKKALIDKVITSYCKDMGRQRTSMLVAANCANSIKKVREDNVNITKNLKCDDEPNIPPDPDLPVKDIVEMTGTIKQLLNFKLNPTSRDETVKQIERKRKIVEIVNERCIIQVQFLRQEIIKCEQEAGYKDEICNKSLYRIIARLQDQGILNLFEMSLRFEEHARLYRYVTHPKISKDHHIMSLEIIKLKNAFFLYLEERKCRVVAQKTGTSTKDKNERIGLIPIGPQKAPKFLTARFIHEFMFYLLLEMKPHQEPIDLTEDLLSIWLQHEPNIDCSDLYKSMIQDRIQPYRESINWKTFITPLPTYEEKPFGWMSLPDVVDRMPFSLLNKLIHVPSTVDPLALELLRHPVKQHYQIKQLPLSIQALINRNRLSRIICSIVAIIQRMGLIQVTEKKGKDPLRIWVYLNRKATVLDTTASEPGYIKINSDREYPKINFHFKKSSDLKQYWNCIHKICVLTKLGFVHKNTPNSDTKAVYKRRRHELNEIVYPVTNFEEAPALDTGNPPGDGLGAGGLASGLYSSFQRNWTWLVNNKHTAAAAAAAQKLKKSTKYIRTRMSKLASEAVIKKSPTSPGSVAVKKLTRLVPSTTGRVIKRRAKVVPSKIKSAFPVDSVDRDAIRQMRSLRARWSTKEDLILKMARATFLFLGVPVVHFNHRDVAKIARDIIRRKCGIYNKTTQTCHRRINFLIKTNRHIPELPTWLHALQTNEHLAERYDPENFFRDLRELYPVKSEFQRALVVHFLYAYEKLQAQLKLDEPRNKAKRQSNFPDTLAQFYKLYREVTPIADEKALLYLNPANELDLQLATINNVLHSSLSCVRDKTQYNLQIFDIFKTYSEDVLNMAFKIARIDGLVVSRKKSQVQPYTTQMTGPAFVFSNRYRMSLMFLRYPYIVIDMLYGFFEQTTKQIFGSNPTPVEIKSPHSGQLFFIGELICHDIIVVDIKPPSNMLTIDPMAQQTTITHTQKIMDHFHNLMENATQTEYSKHFDAMGELSTRVKFKAGNVKHKLYYNPFDVISKLSSVRIHFFCFLGNINHMLDLTFSGYDDKPDNFCPFDDCVMKSDDYLNAIEKIVKSREALLDDINKDRPVQTVFEGDSILMNAETLLASFDKFKYFMKNKLAKEDKKDFGSITLFRKPLDLLELCESILKNCDDMPKNDEHEPVMTKDEKIARASDVFVVHLPTLKIQASKESQTMNKGEFNETLLPESLLQTFYLRDNLLDSIVADACWSYTQNNLNTLRPIMVESGLTDEEQDEVVRIHDFIESYDLGVPAADLIQRFPNVDFLQKAVKLLRQHYLVLRAGVSTFMYVQKNHVRHWVIHTRHIKRLERESMGKLTPNAKTVPQKRKLKTETTDNEPSTSKNSKSNEGKRIPKPLERFEERQETSTSSLETPKNSKELLVLKPCPWIRVNGSLNRRVLDKWLASIVIECSAQTGCTVHSLSLRYKQMHAADIMYLLEVLTELKIVQLRSFKLRKVGLLSTLKELEHGVGNEFTDPRSTYIIAVPDALIRMSLFIGDKLYRTEFV